MYDGGEGVEVNHIKAAYWYKKSADSGLPEAQINLALCYYWGNGTEKDCKEAYKLLALAEKTWHPNAQFWLGQIYELGLDI